MPFRFQVDKKSRIPLYEQIREQIICALHVGRIRPGTKLPSVRHFARVHCVNPKTIHRIYRRLQDDGYLQLRAGSGAYIGPVKQGTVNGDRLLTMHRFFGQFREECERMGLEPVEAADRLRGFLSREASRGGQVAVVECNREQSEVLAHELGDTLGLQAKAVLLDSMDELAVRRTLAEAQVIVTTDFHFDEVRRQVPDPHRPVIQVQLDPSFVPSLVRAADRGTLLMVLSDVAGMDAFVRSVSTLGLPPDRCQRIRMIDAQDPDAVRREALAAEAVYVSPLVRQQVVPMLPPEATLLLPERHLSPESVDLVEAAFYLTGDPVPLS